MAKTNFLAFGSPGNCDVALDLIDDEVHMIITSPNGKETLDLRAPKDEFKEAVAAVFIRDVVRDDPSLLERIFTRGIRREKQ